MQPRTGPAQTQLALPYATGSPAQTLDLYLPEQDGSRVSALVVLIHGGGFSGGDSRDETDLAHQLTEQGFAVASLNYRLSGQAPFPAGLLDVKAAVRYLRAHAPRWGVDPGRIAVWGASAGGYLASMIGVTGSVRTFDDPSLGNADVSSAVAAVASWYGPVNFATMDDQARAAGCDPAAINHNHPDSPESTWLGAALPQIPDKVTQASVVQQLQHATHVPPFLLVHGEQDCTVAPGQSQELADALRAKGVEVTLTLVPRAGHQDPRITRRETGPLIDFLHGALD